MNDELFILESKRLIEMFSNRAKVLFENVEYSLFVATGVCDRNVFIGTR